MAHDSIGSLNEPQYASTGAPADAADLSELGTFAATVGNRMRGTHAARPSTALEGQEYVETDTKNVYVMSSSAWVPDRHYGLAQGNTFQRPGTSDTFAGGSFVSLMSGTITGAPAGRYLVSGNVVIQVPTQTPGFLRISASTSNLSRDMAQTFSAGATAPTALPPYVFLWTGGDLLLSLAFQINTGITGTVLSGGTFLTWQYLNP